MPPQAVVFDVNETLFSLEPVRTRFDRTGLGAETVPEWFASVLRDGFAVAAAGGFAAFPDIARFHAKLEARHHGFLDEDAIADEVLEGFQEVGAHHDVPDALRALKDAGATVATFTNGTAAITRTFLEHAGLEDLVDHVLDVSGPEVWKPAPAAYRWACEQVGVDPTDAAMVAVHPWDVHGAQQVGMTGVYLDRDGDPYPPFLDPADVHVTSLDQLVEALG